MRTPLCRTKIGIKIEDAILKSIQHLDGKMMEASIALNKLNPDNDSSWDNYPVLLAATKANRDEATRLNIQLDLLQTLERFLPSPEDLANIERMAQTGDLEFVGNQIIVKPRVSVVELEKAINERTNPEDKSTAVPRPKSKAEKKRKK